MVNIKKFLLEANVYNTANRLEGVVNVCASNCIYRGVGAGPVWRYPKDMGPLITQWRRSQWSAYTIM